ncbi:hypothetical protein JXL83_07275 [candidate division WOR-3 bacterium]|nr:hypothetical protein [candidate division WOR-3 bacterium]
MRKTYLVPLSALLFQIIPPFLIYVLSWAIYSDQGFVPHSLNRFLSLSLLLFSSSVSLFLGNYGSYLLLIKENKIVDLLMILLCCVPALLAGSFYLHALLVFMAIV